MAQKLNWEGILVLLVAPGLLVGSGCGGDARVELSAADTLDRVAREVEVAFGEYHAEVKKGDDRREMRLTSDFLARVRRDARKEALLDQHAADFVSTLAKIRQDREVEAERYSAVGEHVEVVREVSVGLREIALQDLYLDQEVRNYFDQALSRLAAPKPDRIQTGSSNTVDTSLPGD